MLTMISIVHCRKTDCILTSLQLKTRTNFALIELKVELN